LEYYPDLFLQESIDDQHSVWHLITNDSFSIDYLHMILEHLKTRDQLYVFIPDVRWLYNTITVPMIQMLFEYIPKFNPSYSYDGGYSFIMVLIAHWESNPTTSPTDILQEIKKHYSTFPNNDLPIRCSWKQELNDFIKSHSHIVHRVDQPNPSVTLVELCPNLFPHIERSNLTQDLANAYYSYQDQDPKSYQLIPEEYRENLTDTRPGSKTKPALRTDSTFT
jgi:hypothetical protein